MRTGIIVAILALLLVMASGSGIKAVYAADEELAFEFDTADINYQNTPVNKFGRGVVNTATCWAEIPGEFFRVSNQSDPSIGLTLGVMQGTINAILRGAVGIFDTLTFFIPPYNKPEMKPEYALQSADKSFREYLW
jgi:putative exosortase-associated protein (TIGR04073 family)